MTSEEPTRQVVVVGGGITGLASALRAREIDPSARLTLLEAGPRLGGVLGTVRRDGFLIEQSADSFITTVPAALDLCRRAGCEGDLIPTSESHRQAKIVFRGRLVPAPAGFMLMAPSRLWPMLTTPLLSVRGKARLLAEFLIPPLRKAEDQTLAGFARRRFGREVFERLIQPLIGGIYTADPERLSLAATLPRFLELERHFGSLLAAAREGAMRTSADEDAATSGARYGMFVAPRDGMDQWIARLAARLPAGSVRLNSPVASVGRESDDRWTVALESGERIAADAVIVAVPARAAARLLAGETGLAENLQKIPYASTAIVSLGFRRADVRQPLDAFGFVAPACERRRILAASFSSVKYPGRAPDDALLARVFIGGACQAELLEQDDAGLIRLAIEELSALLEITAPPIMTHLTRWPTTMPQYHLGHLSLVEALEAQVAKLPGLALAGASYRGVGIPHCVRSGETAAAAALGASRVA